MGRTPKGYYPRYEQLKEQLDKMELGQSFCKNDYIIEMQGKKYLEKNHWFYTRSFDVIFVTAKKMIPEKTFRSINKRITRIL